MTDAPIELLAPARNADVAIAAINHGADAVYIGAESHGARSQAANSVDDIARVCRYAHRYQARVYVALNTLVYPREVEEVETLVWRLWRAGVDALIVQDLGLLRMQLPPVALHASTQMDIRTPQKARWLQDLGMSQLVLPREMTLEEIKAVRRATDVPLEAFVHGALCVSYSGQCYASLLCGGRSANRGECAQICRLPYTLTDGRGRVLATDRHLLSLRDLNRMAHLRPMIEAGVRSFKIEGRLKDEAYVKNVVSAYDQALAKLGVKRTSLGHAERRFVPDVRRSFNRGFTPGFLLDPRATGVAGIETPKMRGVEVGKVSKIRGNRIALCRPARLNNGDGLTFTAPGGKTMGFRVNRFEPPLTIVTAGAPPGELRPGAVLWRNSDQEFQQQLASPKSARRTILLDITLRCTRSQLVMEAMGCAAAIDLPDMPTARTPQQEARRRAVDKLGETEFAVASLTDRLGERFVAASTLSRLRNLLVQTLRQHIAASMSRPLRRAEKAVPLVEPVTAGSNICNPLSRQLLLDHGHTGDVEPAPEWGGEPQVAMTMRYCLRRELGRCLLTPAGREWAEPLTLTGAPRPMQLEFDCRNCLMKLRVK